MAVNNFQEPIVLFTPHIVLGRVNCLNHLSFEMKYHDESDRD